MNLIPLQQAADELVLTPWVARNRFLSAGIPVYDVGTDFLSDYRVEADAVSRLLESRRILPSVRRAGVPTPRRKAS